MASSPAEVVQRLLISGGVCILPGVSQIQPSMEAQCFYASANDDIDRMVLVEDCAGTVMGRSQRYGNHDQYYGIKITVRDADKNKRSGWNLCRAVEAYLDSIKTVQVCHENVTHNVHSIFRKGPFHYLGEEEDKRRFLWGLYAMVVFETYETTTPEC